MSVSPTSTAGLKNAFEVTIELTRRCELSCSHCYTRSFPTENVALPRERLLRLFDEFEQMGVLMLLLDGGDPVAHPNFFEILENAVRRFVVNIYTPAVSLDEAGIKEIARIRPAHIFAKFPGATPSAYESRTGEAGAFEKACRAVLALKKVGQSTSIVAIGTRQALTELGDYAKLCRKLGIKKLNYVRFYPVGRGADNRAAMEPSAEEIDTFVGKAARVKNLEVIHPYFPRLHNCCRVFSTILADQKVIPCTYLRENIKPFGDLRHSSFEKIWSSPAYYKHRNISPLDPCRQCKLWDICQGGCRASAVIESGRMDEADPSCPIVRQSRGDVLNLRA